MIKIIFILLLFVNTAYAQILTDKTNNHLFFGDSIEYYEDKNNLDLSGLLKESRNWKSSSLKNLSFGLTKSAYWIRFDLENKTDRELFLTFNVVNNDSINLYILNKDGSYTEKTGGSLYPFNHREVYDKDIFFAIPKYNGTKTIYARFVSNYLMVLTPEIVTSDKKTDRAIKAYLPYLIYYGFLLALIIYNFFIFIFLRERNYLILVLVIFSFGLYDIAHDGIGYMFFWPDSPFIENMSVLFTICLLGITTGLFILFTLEINKKHRILYWLINSYIIMGFVIGILCFFLEKPVLSIILLLYVVHCSLFSIIPLFYLGVVKKNRTAFFLFLGFLFQEIGNFLGVANSNPSLIKIFPVLNDYSMILFMLKIARAWFVIIISFILADKINIMKKNLEISNDKLGKSEQTYRSIFNATNEAICLLDIHDYSIIDANNSMLKIFNLEYSGIVGKKHDFFGSIEDGYNNRKASSAFKRILVSGLPVEWLFKKQDGSKFWAEVTVSRVLINGIERFMMVIRDISERKKSEEEKEKMMQQLVQAQKMEAVGTLAGGLAHDFNNVLTGILGSSSMVEKQLNDNIIDSSKISKYISIIKESSIKASGTIKRLLTLTRKNELKFTAVDLNNSLKNVYDICLNSFSKSINLQIKYYVSPAIINADFGGLEQIFLNLFVNASHAVTTMRNNSESEGGTISIKIDKHIADERFCRVHSDAELGKKYFTVSVSDDGSGIEHNVIDKIFDPFFSTKGESGGSGLGLTMVYNIVKQHKGIIEVFSEKGLGTTFIVYLPEYEADNTCQDTDICETVINGHGKILIIDDEEPIRIVAYDILKESGYEVLVASDGTEGIEIYKKNAQDIDAVLLDMSMPGLSGFETFKAIKEFDTSAKVIISSGFGMDERVQKTLEAGADMFIQKPYTNIQLTKAMHDLLASNSRTKKY